MPCTCGHVRPRSHYSPDQCRACWLHQANTAEGKAVRAHLSGHKVAVPAVVQQVPEQVYQQRLAVCHSCPHCEKNRCQLCACAVAGVHAKTRKAAERCPDDPPRWTAHEDPSMHVRWAYGITTVPERRDTLFPKTLASMRAAGFDQPHIFLDGSKDGPMYEQAFGLPVTARWPALRTAGHWILSLYELYIRHHDADRYLIFQDDVQCCADLKEYLTRCAWPEKGYLNCYTMPSNMGVFPREDPPGSGIDGMRTGWAKARMLDSGPEGWQSGRGALALAFAKAAVVTLLSSEHMALRPQNVDRGWKAIDGGIVTAMNKAGWSEYVHHPSLVQHKGGHASTLGNRCPDSPSFLGESWNPLEYLRIG